MNQKKKDDAALEGEGSYTAARRYDAGLAESIKAGKSDELAKEAERALQGPEAASLKEAERIGKSGKPRHAADRKKAQGSSPTHPNQRRSS
jgi:hypothetical protein